MDVAKILKRGFDLSFNDIVPLMVAGLLTIALTPLTLGILGGPMLFGMFRMVLLRIRENRTPNIGDVFYFENFSRHVIAFYVVGILIVIGCALLVVPGVYLATVWFYVVPLMIDSDIGVQEAMRKSKAIVDRIGLGQQFALVLVLIIGETVLGSLTKMLGTLIMLPFSVACSVTAYDEVISGNADAS